MIQHLPRTLYQQLHMDTPEQEFQFLGKLPKILKTIIAIFETG
jgi:hypothetical protein